MNASSYLRIRVQPGAKRTEAVGFAAGVFKLRVTAPPERGRANQAALDLLARLLRVPKSHLVLERGANARDKVVRVEGLDEAGLRRRLGGSYHHADALEQQDRHHGRQVHHAEPGEDVP